MKNNKVSGTHQEIKISSGRSQVMTQEKTKISNGILHETVFNFSLSELILWLCRLLTTPKYGILNSTVFHNNHKPTQILKMISFFGEERIHFFFFF